MDGVMHLDEDGVLDLGEQLRRIARAADAPGPTTEPALPADRHGAGMALAALLEAEARATRSCVGELEELAQRCDRLVTDVLTADRDTWASS